MAGAPRYENQIDWRRPIQYALANFAQTVTAGGTTYQGFDIVEQPVSGPNGIAWEFTGQVVTAMQYVDNLYGTSLFSNSASFYLGQIDQAQATAPFGDGEGLVASTLQDGDALPPIDQCLNTPFQTIPERVGLAATTWAIFADQGINVFAPPPQVIVTSSPASSSTYGQSLTFSVTVTPSVSGSPTPTGTVQFQVDGSNFGPAVTLLNGAATSISTATLSAGVHAITAFYSGDWNDAANSRSLSQTVDPAALTITANDASKTYGQTLTFAGTEFTDSGLVNGNTVSSVTLTSNGAPASEQVASSPYPIIPSAAVGSGLSNYTITYVNGRLTVNKAHLTVTADNKSKTQGHPNPPLTSTITGFVNGDKPTVVSGAAVLTTSATTSSPVGSYPITVAAGTLSAANYDFPNLVNGTLTVTVPLVASVAVVPSVASPTYGQALTFTATVSPASSAEPTPGGTVQFKVDGVNLGPAVNLVKGAATSIATSTLGAGTHTVTAVYSGDNTYAGNSGNRGLTVAKAHLTVTADTKSKVYGAAVPTLTATISGFVNGDKPTVVRGAPKLTTTATTTCGVGTYSITITTGTLSAANYDFPNLVNGMLTVTKAQLTVTAVNKTKKQGAANPALTYTITGFVNGDKSTVVHGKPTLSTTAVKTSPAGNYPIIVALGTLSASNYDFSLVNGTLTVTGAKASALGVAVAQAPDSEASPSPFDRLIPRWWRKGHGLSRNS